jgi:hypothetical protein
MEHPESCDRLDAELRHQLGLGASGDVEVSAAAASGDKLSRPQRVNSGVASPPNPPKACSIGVPDVLPSKS